MYYRLTYKKAADKALIGDSVLCGLRPLSIGQTSKCGLVIPASGEVDPSPFATICPADNGREWFVVRTSDYYDVKVNGRNVQVAQILKNHDVLEFSDGWSTTVFIFNTLDDGEYDSTKGIVYKNNRNNFWLSLIALSLTLVALSVAFYSLFISDKKEIQVSDVAPFKKCVWRITVDSVYLMADTVIEGRQMTVAIDSVQLEVMKSGTCFLTSDSLIVTARHCIEPWITDEEWDGGTSLDMMSPELRLATFAETQNRQSFTSKYSLKAHCVILKDENQQSIDCYSTDFCMNKSRDQILRLGSKEEDIYWRTIFPMAHRLDMELGDFAYMITDSAGTISMADMNNMKSFWNDNTNHQVVVVGYPLHDKGVDDKASCLDGVCQNIYFDDNEETGMACCQQMKAAINPGNSGGPVFAFIQGEIKVIGIVSKADGKAEQDMFWSVPVTEVVDMHHKGDEIKIDNSIYRR